MPKVSEMMKKGKFLKTEDIEEMGGEFEGTIVGVKEMNVAMDNQPEQMKWVMKFRELEQLFVLNNTNLQLIEKALGTDDSAEWKGKTLTLYADPNVQMGGKLVGGIRVRVPTAKPKPKSQQDGEAQGEGAPAKPRKPAHFDDFEDDIPF